MGSCVGIPRHLCNLSGLDQTPSPAPVPGEAAPLPLRPHKKSPALNVLQRPMVDVTSEYTIGSMLGRGQYGVVSLCTHKATGQTYACKSISKRKLISKEDVEDVRHEVQIMHHVTGHPNIVELKGSYEDRDAVHLVMELCSGGELFDHILAKGRYTERAAADLCRTIVEVVETCHSLGVIHRDLKPENFLFLNKQEDSPLKATDFGLSVFFKPGQVFRDIVGSAYYVAPEVLRESYGPAIDIWSAGIILYILLCGVPPFYADTEEGTFEAIKRGTFSFPHGTISPAAMDLVKRMLKQDPKERLTAYEVLRHPWIRRDGEARDRPLDNAVLARMKNFTAMNKFKKLALKVLAESLTENEIAGLREMFKNIDHDNTGTITLEELRKGLAEQGANLTEMEVSQLMESADLDGNGKIDYMEFIAATVHMNQLDNEERLTAAFQYFDKDNSGYITKEELEEALAKTDMDSSATIQEIIEEADTDHDGQINYQEFVAMMRKTKPALNHRRQ